MKTGGIAGIDSSQIQAMMAQLKAAASRPQVAVPDAAGLGVAGVAGTPTETPAAKVNFSDALKAQLDAVNGSMVEAGAKGNAFTRGDDSVSLSDVMISMQKASINFQASIQVRNKLVSAYHDIMNMQV
ncbi:flagellar hook-basal body complex protein FliE [Rugamonas sp.]|uniref:flagellar hook-basal body complex protein FliE n=1 Tax=Rugamonas sp. TaxID=1926287 RepID=UPI0025EBE27C|nr:flagellar hook-basal body complex protein FliE [Rugamonas sp.]